MDENNRIRLIDLANAQSSNIKISPEEWSELRKKAQSVAMANVPREHLGRYRDPEAKKLVKYQILQVVEKEYPGLPHQVLKWE